MENQNEKVNDVNGTDNNGQVQEPETVITTKEALKAIRHNAKVKAKETWESAKPKLKKAAVIGGGLLAVGYALNKINQPALEQKDEDWTDDDIVDGTATVVDVGDGTITFEPKEDEPAAETTEE